MPTSTVLVVRHAAPVLPVAGTLPHVDDERDLTLDGRLAAQELGERLAVHGISAIYSSPARRAVATIQPLADAFGLQIRTREDLTERWLADRILDEDGWLEVFRRTWLDADHCPDGGESRRATQQRALAALDDIADRHPREAAVASTHGGLIACLLRSFDDAMPFDEALAIPMPAVYALERREGVWRISDQESNDRPATFFPIPD